MKGLMNFDDEATLYAQLKQDLSPYRHLLEKAADTIENERVSNYPILLVTQQPSDLGIELFNPTKSQINWYVQALTVEVLVSKQMIDIQKIDIFRTHYNQHRPALCLLISIGTRHSFVFWSRHDTA